MLNRYFTDVTDTYMILLYLSDPLIMLTWLNQINIYQYLTVTFKYLVYASTGLPKQNSLAFPSLLQKTLTIFPWLLE